MRALWADRDERAVAVEHRAGWVGFQVIVYALLVDMVLRAWWPGIADQTLGLFETGFPVDIPIVISIGGVAQWIVILRGRIVGRERALAVAILLAASVVLSAAIAWLVARL